MAIVATYKIKINCMLKKDAQIPKKISLALIHVIYYSLIIRNKTVPTHHDLIKNNQVMPGNRM
jgi:hypothetical protein